MSRSFTVRIAGKTLTSDEIIESISKLKSFDRLYINIDDIEIINHSPCLITFVLENAVHLKFLGNHVSIESRALDGKGRSLFIAISSVVSILLDSPVSSCDGAWYNDNIYSGVDLWNEYLDTEINI